MPFELQFGRRRPGTAVEDLVIEEIFKPNAEIDMEAEDFENIVYIVNMTDIQSKTPKKKLVTIEGTTERTLEFEERVSDVAGDYKKCK